MAIPLAHASVPVIDGSFFQASCTNPCNLSTTVAAGDFILVHTVCPTSASGDVNTPTDNLGNGYTRIVHIGTGTFIESVWQAVSAPVQTSITVTVTQPGGSGCSPFTASVETYSRVVSLGATNQNTGSSASASGSDSLTMTINANSLIYETFNEQAGTTLSGSSGQTVRDLYTFPTQLQQIVMDRTYLTGGSTASVAAWSGASGTSVFQHIVIELRGGIASNVNPNVITTCYGNCGTPAVTLTNPNATHTVNFNQSITLFYAFQSGLNGVVNNVTTNVAKAYPNGLQVGLAWYTAVCNPGTTPFTTNCPGTRQGSKINFVFTKGQDILLGQTTPITTGEWLGIAVTSQISGLDLNSTNALCQPSCLNSPNAMSSAPGFVPSIITSNTVCSSANSPCNVANINSVGLWMWFTGTLNPIPVPVTAGPCINNFAQLDCMLPALTNGLCSVITPSCQTSSSLLWIIILTFLSFLLVTVGFASAHVTKFVAAGDVFMFFFLAWFFIFAGVGLLQSFVIIFFLFIGAVAFGKTARNYF